MLPIVVNTSSNSYIICGIIYLNNVKKVILLDRIILEHLKSRKRKEIFLSEIEKLFEGNTEYHKFAEAVLKLQEKGIIIPIKSHKTNNKSISLYNTYRINKSYFKDQLIEKIQTFKLKSHKDIKVQSYFSKSEREWAKDFPYIQVINNYLNENGFPQREVSSPERSYEIVGDEKWIDEKGGKKLLERLNIFHKLKISYNVDPLMIAVNPKQINNPPYKHMIVENKATFYDFLYNLYKTEFTSLVYGAGWKIVSNIYMLEVQLGLKGYDHRLFYFGDLDYEGISIWESINEKLNVIPAVSFYSGLLNKPSTKGKTNQTKNENGVNKFSTYFSKEESNKIKNLLNQESYYPQEGLNKEEIFKIWRIIE